MVWGKAGRPRKTSSLNCENSSVTYVTVNNDYTKLETKLPATKREAIGMLANAVIHQWIRDNRPMHDLEAIQIWHNISMHIQRSRHTGIDTKYMYTVHRE